MADFGTFWTFCRTQFTVQILLLLLLLYDCYAKIVLYSQEQSALLCRLSLSLSLSTLGKEGKVTTCCLVALAVPASVLLTN